MRMFIYFYQYLAGGVFLMIFSSTARPLIAFDIANGEILVKGRCLLGESRPFLSDVWAFATGGLINLLVLEGCSQPLSDSPICGSILVLLMVLQPVRHGVSTKAQFFYLYAWLSSATCMDTQLAYSSREGKTRVRRLNLIDPLATL